MDLLKAKQEAQKSHELLQKKHNDLERTYTEMAQIIREGYQKIGDEDGLTPIEMYGAVEAHISDARAEIEALKSELGKMLLE